MTPDSGIIWGEHLGRRWACRDWVVVREDALHLLLPHSSGHEYNWVQIPDEALHQLEVARKTRQSGRYDEALRPLVQHADTVDVAVVERTKILRLWRDGEMFAAAAAYGPWAGRSGVSIRKLREKK